MATKPRSPVKRAGEHTDGQVKAFAAKWGYSEKDAWAYLAQYALNRLATLDRYASSKPAKPKKEKKERKPRAKKAAAAKVAA